MPNTPISQLVAQAMGGDATSSQEGSVASLVDIYARKHGVDPALARRLMHQESGGHKNATSPVGAMGVMQLMPDTAKSLGVTDPYDLHQNIEGGIRYLKQQLDAFGDVNLALAAYNAGPGAVKKYGGIPPYAETQNYVRRIGGGYSGNGRIGGGSIADLVSSAMNSDGDGRVQFVHSPNYPTRPASQTDGGSPSSRVGFARYPIRRPKPNQNQEISVVTGRPVDSRIQAVRQHPEDYPIIDRQGPSKAMRAALDSDVRPSGISEGDWQAARARYQELKSAGQVGPWFASPLLGAVKGVGGLAKTGAGLTELINDIMGSSTAPGSRPVEEWLRSKQLSADYSVTGAEQALGYNADLADSDVPLSQRLTGFAAKTNADIVSSIPDIVSLGVASRFKIPVQVAMAVQGFLNNYHEGVGAATEGAVSGAITGQVLHSTGGLPLFQRALAQGGYMAGESAVRHGGLSDILSAGAQGAGLVMAMPGEGEKRSLLESGHYAGTDAKGTNFVITNDGQLHTNRGVDRVILPPEAVDFILKTTVDNKPKVNGQEGRFGTDPKRGDYIESADGRRLYLEDDSQVEDKPAPVAKTPEQRTGDVLRTKATAAVKRIQTGQLETIAQDLSARLGDKAHEVEMPPLAPPSEEQRWQNHAWDYAQAAAWHIYTGEENWYDNFKASLPEDIRLSDDYKAELERRARRLLPGGLDESKARTPQGELVRTHHGTDKFYHQYDPRSNKSSNMLGPGNYQDESSEVANGYTIDVGGQEGKGENIRPQLLDVRDPLELSKKDAERELRRRIKEALHSKNFEPITKLFQTRDSWWNDEDTETELHMLSDMTLTASEEGKSLWEVMERVENNLIDPANFRFLAEGLGYDSIAYRNISGRGAGDSTGGVSRTWVAFHPEQIVPALYANTHKGLSIKETVDSVASNWEQAIPDVKTYTKSIIKMLEPVVRGDVPLGYAVASALHDPISIGMFHDMADALIRHAHDNKLPIKLFIREEEFADPNPPQGENYRYDVSDDFGGEDAGRIKVASLYAMNPIATQRVLSKYGIGESPDAFISRAENEVFKPKTPEKMAIDELFSEERKRRPSHVQEAQQRIQRGISHDIEGDLPTSGIEDTGWEMYHPLISYPAWREAMVKEFDGTPGLSGKLANLWEEIRRQETPEQYEQSPEWRDDSGDTRSFKDWWDKTPEMAGAIPMGDSGHFVLGKEAVPEEEANSETLQWSHWQDDPEVRAMVAQNPHIQRLSIHLDHLTDALKEFIASEFEAQGATGLAEKYRRAKWGGFFLDPGSYGVNYSEGSGLVNHGVGNLYLNPFFMAKTFYKAAYELNLPESGDWARQVLTTKMVNTLIHEITHQEAEGGGNLSPDEQAKRQGQSYNHVHDDAFERAYSRIIDMTYRFVEEHDAELRQTLDDKALREIGKYARTLYTQFGAYRNRYAPRIASKRLAQGGEFGDTAARASEGFEAFPTDSESGEAGPAKSRDSESPPRKGKLAETIKDDFTYNEPTPEEWTEAIKRGKEILNQHRNNMNGWVEQMAKEFPAMSPQQHIHNKIMWHVISNSKGKVRLGPESEPISEDNFIKAMTPEEQRAEDIKLIDSQNPEEYQDFTEGPVMARDDEPPMGGEGLAKKLGRRFQVKATWVGDTYDDGEPYLDEDGKQKQILKYTVVDSQTGEERGSFKGFAAAQKGADSLEKSAGVKGEEIGRRAPKDEANIDRRLAEYYKLVDIYRAKRERRMPQMIKAVKEAQAMGIDGQRISEATAGRSPYYTEPQREGTPRGENIDLAGRSPRAIWDEYEQLNKEQGLRQEILRDPDRLLKEARESGKRANDYRTELSDSYQENTKHHAELQKIVRSNTFREAMLAEDGTAGPTSEFGQKLKGALDNAAPSTDKDTSAKSPRNNLLAKKTAIESAKAWIADIKKHGIKGSIVDGSKLVRLIHKYITFDPSNEKKVLHNATFRVKKDSSGLARVYTNLEGMAMINYWKPNDASRLGGQAINYAWVEKIASHAGTIEQKYREYSRSGDVSPQEKADYSRRADSITRMISSLRESVKSDGNSAVVISTDLPTYNFRSAIAETIRHEETHREQYRWDINAEPHGYNFQDHPLYATAEAHLKEIGYSDNDVPVEIPAWISGGGWEDIGLSRDEAKELLRSYYLSFAGHQLAEGGDNLAGQKRDVDSLMQAFKRLNPQMTGVRNGIREFLHKARLDADAHFSEGFREYFKDDYDHYKDTETWNIIHKASREAIYGTEEQSNPIQSPSGDGGEGILSGIRPPLSSRRELGDVFGRSESREVEGPIPFEKDEDAELLKGKPPPPDERPNRPALTEPELKVDIHKGFYKLAGDLLVQKGIRRQKGVTMQQQTYDTIVNSSAADLIDINRYLENKGIDMTSFMLGLALPTGSDAGRILNTLSQVAKSIGEKARREPNFAKELERIQKAQLTRLESLSQGLYARWTGIFKGAMVGAWSTATRNAASQGARLGIDAMVDGLDGALQVNRGLADRPGGVHPLDGVEILLQLGKEAKTSIQQGATYVKGKLTGKEVSAPASVADQLLSALPGLKDKLYQTFLSDVENVNLKLRPRATRAERFTGKVEDAVQLINFLNVGQEYTVRRAVFTAKMFQEARNRGIDLHDIIERNDRQAMQNLPKDMWEAAIHKALDASFAAEPENEIAIRALHTMRAIQKSPAGVGLLLDLPFPRFLIQALKFHYQYSPVSIPELLFSDKAKAQIAAGDHKRIARAAIGTAMLGIGYAIAASRRDDERWYEFYGFDTRPFNPFAGYMFLGDAIYRKVNGKEFDYTPMEFVNSLMALGSRADTSLTILGRLVGVVTQEDSKGVGQHAEEYIGDVVSRFFQPVTTIKDIYASTFDAWAKYITGHGGGEATLRDVTTNNPLIAPTMNKLPGVSQLLPEAETPTKAPAPQQVAPWAKQIFGLRFMENKTPLESELQKANMKFREVFTSSGDVDFDRDMQHFMGELNSGPEIEAYLKSPEFQNMKPEEKAYVLSVIESRVREAARAQAIGQAPEKYNQFRFDSMPKRKRRLVLSEMPERPPGL
jgi:hypothetical protein